MLVFFIYDFFTVTDYIFEKIISALFQAQRMEFRINRIPIILIRNRINVIYTRIVNKQSFGYFLENFITLCHI